VRVFSNALELVLTPTGLVLEGVILSRLIQNEDSTGPVAVLDSLVKILLLFLRMQRFQDVLSWTLMCGQSRLRR